MSRSVPAIPRSSPPSGEATTLVAGDGFVLGVTRFVAQGALRGHLVVAGATGVPQAFYRRFAEYAASQGFTTMTLDFRGVGRSRPSTLVGFDADMLDWARLDLAAAVDAMTADDIPLFMVGHSFGGHAFGLLPNHPRVASFYTFGTGAGWHGWMPRSEGLRVRFMWNVVFPLLARWKGYLPSSMLGLGADLPLGVYREWRRWCSFPHHIFDDPSMPDVAARFAEVRTPIVAANALDDPWAPPRSRDAFVSGYRNAPVTRVDLDPRTVPGGIGHMGYFRERASRLWDDALTWFARSAADSALSNPTAAVAARDQNPAR